MRFLIIIFFSFYNITLFGHYKNAPSILVLIPARGGSEGIKNKNIIDFCGHPLIRWTIDEAKKSKYITDIAVSSDSDEILNISKDDRVILIKRPKKLSTSTSKTIEAVMHALNFLKSQGRTYDYLLLLQPTSPLRTVHDINGIIKKVLKNNWNSAVSVTQLSLGVPLMRYINNSSSRLDHIVDESSDLMRQDFKPLYYVDGALYLFKTKILSLASSLNNGEYGYIMDSRHSIDINTSEDLERAKETMQQCLKKSNN